MRSTFHVSARQALIGYELTRCANMKRDCLRANNLHSINVEIIPTFSPTDCRGWQFQRPRGKDEQAAAGQDPLKGVSYLSIGVHKAPLLAEAAGDVQRTVCMARGYGLLTQAATGDVGVQCSLELDGRGCPHVSYWNLTNGHLKYASIGYRLYHLPVALRGECVFAHAGAVGSLIPT